MKLCMALQFDLCIIFFNCACVQIKSIFKKTMARRDEYGLYDLDTESSSVDTLILKGHQGAICQRCHNSLRTRVTHNVILILQSIESIMSLTAMYEMGTPEKTGNLTIDLQIRGINNTSVSMDPAQMPLPQSSHQETYKPQQQGWNRGQQWHTASGQQGQTMSQSQWHENKKCKAESDPAGPQTETTPAQAEQSPKLGYNNQYRGGYHRGGYTGRMHQGKPLYKIQGEIVALCMPCNSVHIGNDQCEYDPDFGPIPSDLEMSEQDDTFHEDGDSVDLQPEPEVK